jgi:hypothetical protein
MPDVFSIRHTTVEDYLEPVVHEVKVRRADLLADLKRSAKRAAYLQLAGECWYVIRAGIAEPDEIPRECGVLVAAADGGALEVARPAPRRSMRLSFQAWMALARATPVNRGSTTTCRAGSVRPMVRPMAGTTRDEESRSACGRPSRRSRAACAAHPRALGRVGGAGADRRLGRELQRAEGGLRALSPGGFLFVRYLVMPAAASLLLCWLHGTRWPRVGPPTAARC